ncbi:MAG TPA: formylmethanofuran--tetrahydromethanopterin N-formyltransferase [Planctomycetaceae bacterium]|nr:formylmethanofuran--tetrahydromethanopterin N-formyltransferase [Planctomycetaceae bacterium]HRE99991.1 formylmethanofuran--tetrahydromethanopterin N-formyltransferase [Pirellulaceae bacterium]
MPSRPKPQLIDTFAEAFDMRCTRLIVTADDLHWLDAALRSVAGYASSVIGCDAEVGVERRLNEEETPDGRPGAAVLAFGFSADGLGKAIANRVGQCLMTAPTASVFDGMPDEPKRLPLGRRLRYFGDGFQKSKQIDGARSWRVPVMDGEFWVADEIGFRPGIGGGNLIFQSRERSEGLAAARGVVEAIAPLVGTITPFPGGIARSGSKVGSRYPGLVASTADAYCPTLRGRTASVLHAEAQCAYEVVIDGIDRASIETAMRVGIETLERFPLVAIGAGNYGGRLGKHHFRLRELAPVDAS